MAKLIKRIKRFQPGGKTYPSDLPVWGREVYDSYEHPRIKYIKTKTPYVAYEGSNTEPGYISYTTGILPEITITPNTYKNQLTAEDYYSTGLHTNPFAQDNEAGIYNPWDINSVEDYYLDKFYMPEKGSYIDYMLQISPDEEKYMLLDHGKKSSSYYTKSMLDWVAEQYSKAGVPLIYMLGHPYKESTWYNDVIDPTRNKLTKGNYIKQTTQSHWSPWEHLDPMSLVNMNGLSKHSIDSHMKYGYEDAVEIARQNMSPKEIQLNDMRNNDDYTFDDIERFIADNNIDMGAYYQKIDSGRDEVDRKNSQIIEGVLPRYIAEFKKYGWHNHPFYNAAIIFGTGKYNPGQHNYYQLVENLGRDMLSQPAVQEWIKTQPYYNPNTIEEDFQKYKREHNLYNK